MIIPEGLPDKRCKILSFGLGRDQDPFFAHKWLQLLTVNIIDQVSRIPQDNTAGIIGNNFKWSILQDQLMLPMKKGQGIAAEPSGFKEIVVDAEEHRMKLLNPPESLLVRV